tara:strand:- start:7811 stop:8884 length:1074 start_codon:yes stop_codon:yes gene_type:complete
MKVKRKLLLEPTENKWEARAVLNPCVIKEKNVEHLIYRAVAKNWVSSLGYASIINNKITRESEPLISPTEEYETKGIEDPRLTKIDDTYYLLYTAFDGKDAQIAYAVSKDLRNWKKKGIISPKLSVTKARELVKIKKYRDKWGHQEIYGSETCLWDKDAILFPEKINGNFIMLHRFLPDIQIVKFKDFSELKSTSFWEDYIKNLSEAEDKVSLYRRYDWEAEHIGAGAVPIKTKHGWLLIYHGVEIIKKNFLTTAYNNALYKIEGCFHKLRNKRLPMVYHAGAALLDLKNPEIEISRLKRPLFSPKFDWEKQGDVNDVVFPEGVTLEKDNLKIYYGCADKRIGLAEVSFKELMKNLI